MDAVSVSASKSATGKRVNITLVNVDPKKVQTVECDLRGFTVKKVTGSMITSDKINDFNSFAKPNTVIVKEFKDTKITKGVLSIPLPAKSVVLIEIE